MVYIGSGSLWVGKLLKEKRGTQLQTKDLGNVQKDLLQYLLSKYMFKHPPFTIVSKTEKLYEL